MSVNAWEVYIRCPSCREETTMYDFHKNASSDREELFVVLNVGKNSNHLLGSPANKPVFKCAHCGNETPYETLFTEGSCRVEELEKYKHTLKRRMQWADRNGRVSFSDWDPDWNEEPALTRLLRMYPNDGELKRIQSAYRLLHARGKRAVTKCEVNAKTVRREDILVPEVLASVYLGNHVETIAAHTFENCAQLKDIFLPDSIVEIGEFAFANSGLSKIHTSNSIAHIGYRAFCQTNIARFFFPKNAVEIGEECFKDCTYLNDLWIPKQAVIGKNAFAGCTKLKKLQIHKDTPRHVTDSWGLCADCAIEWYED